MMKKVLAIGMLGIFLLAVAAVQPVTASHQKISLPSPAVPVISLKSLPEKLSSIKDLVKSVAKKKESLVSIMDNESKLIPILMVIYTFLIIVAIIVNATLGRGLLWKICVFLAFIVYIIMWWLGLKEDTSDTTSN